MMDQKKGIGAAVVLVALVGIGWFAWQHSHAPADAPAADDKGEPEKVALVKTAPIEQKQLVSALTALGDVNTGKVEGISFPRAGQVASLLVVPGQRVRPGTPLATLAADPSSKAAYDQALSARSFAQNELKRAQELYSLQLATKSQVETAQKALSDAEANLKVQQQAGTGAASSTVTAPFEGVVTGITVAQGDRLQAGAPVMQLGHSDSLRVSLGLEPDDSRLVKVGMPVELTLLNRPGVVVKGKISELQNLIDPKTQLISAIVVLPAKPDSPLLPGMRVRGAINVGEQKALAVPREAVLTDEKGAYIFQVKDNVAHRVAVNPVHEGPDFIGIEGPIDPKLPVVVSGNYELEDGMKVRQGPPSTEDAGAKDEGSKADTPAKADAAAKDDAKDDTKPQVPTKSDATAPDAAKSAGKADTKEGGK